MPRDAGLLSTSPRLSTLAALPREGRAMLNYDVTLAWASLLLLAIGLVMVYSASIAMAEASAHTGYRPWYFLARHFVFVVVGLLSALLAFQVPLKAWQRAAPYLFILGTALLGAGLVPGLGPVEADAEPTRHLDAGQGVRGRDQGLARHAVGQDCSATEAVAVDDGDSRSQVSSDQRRLIPTGTATKDDD